MSETVLHPQVDIATPRLRLRGLQPRDAALIALHASDARVAQHDRVIPHPYPPGLAESFVERARAPGARDRVWALDAGEEGENGLIGLIALKPRGDGEAEIGYWVAPAFWGTGYAGEAVEGGRVLGRRARAARARRRGVPGQPRLDPGPDPRRLRL